MPASKQFFFYTPAGEEPLRPAASLWEFRQSLPKLSGKTIKFHLKRHDFENWMKEVIHDEELARQIRKLAGRKLQGEELREALFATVATRFDELDSLI